MVAIFAVTMIIVAMPVAKDPVIVTPALYTAEDMKMIAVAPATPVSWTPQVAVAFLSAGLNTGPPTAARSTTAENTMMTTAEVAILAGGRSRPILSFFSADASLPASRLTIT